MQCILSSQGGKGITYATETAALETSNPGPGQAIPEGVNRKEHRKKNFYDLRKNLITIYRLTSVNPFHQVNTLKENTKVFFLWKLLTEFF